MQSCTDAATLAVCTVDSTDCAAPGVNGGWRDTIAEQMSAVILKGSGTATETAQNVGRALEPLLDILEQSFSARSTVVWLRNGRSDRLVMLASRGIAEEKRLFPSSQERELFTGIFSSTEVISIPDIKTEPLLTEYFGGEQERRGSFVGAPIVLQGAPVGSVCVYFASEAGRCLEERSNLVEKMALLVGHILDINHGSMWREKGLLAANIALKADIREKVANFLAHHRNRHAARAIRLVREAAAVEVPVLIRGEVGTGKTLAAQAIHELSDRHERPFVRINCRVHEHDLQELLVKWQSGVSGWGAGHSDPSGGVLFLNEIDTMSMASQNQLLQILKQVRPQVAGLAEPTRYEARVVAASEVDLCRVAQSGSFSAELFHLLTTIVIEIPPLRDRREDLSSLIGFFVGRVSNESCHPVKLTPRAMRLLHRHSWPGNVRELENLIERVAFTVGTREIDVDDLSPYTAASLSRFDQRENGGLDALQLLEKRSVVSALERHNWIQSRAARELGITMRQMGYRIQKYHLGNLVRENRRFRKNSGA
jgi:Nif-specific regulatory protein